MESCIVVFFLFCECDELPLKVDIDKDVSQLGLS